MGEMARTVITRKIPANAPTCDTQLQYHTDPPCFSSALFFFCSATNYVKYPHSALKVRQDDKTITVSFKAVIKRRKTHPKAFEGEFMEKKNFFL